jgi:hypothetical protein
MDLCQKMILGYAGKAKRRAILSGAANNGMPAAMAVGF